MARDPRYDILFEPVRIGPVTAPNRFYQVPHCTGMGFNRPNTVAAMRETKAEGGWGVVCIEYCSIHPSSEDSPLPCASLWDDKDIRSHARMVENVHRHGALAGVELWHGGGSTPSLYSREPNDALYTELCEEIDITRVGDCSAPGIIAAAVMAGHRYAQEMDAPKRDVPFLRDEAVIA